MSGCFPTLAAAWLCQNHRTEFASQWQTDQRKAEKGGLADDAANRLQRGELLALRDVQGLVGVEVFGGQHLSASGAHPAVQLSCHVNRCSRRLPGILLVFIFLSSSSPRLLLQCLTVSVRSQKLLLLARVR